MNQNFMQRRCLAIIGFLIFFLMTVPGAFAHNGCGTTQFIQAIRQQRQTGSQPSARQTVSTTDAFTCTAEDLYDSVYSRTTSHFQIFYTLQGPHKTTQAYIDTLANALETAWNFHVSKTGMLPPKGDTLSYHYQKHVQSGLYPVEVIEITLVRSNGYNGAIYCSACFGATLPSSSGKDFSTLIIDNDFLYPPTTNSSYDTVFVNDKKCAYRVSSLALYNKVHSYSYAQNWVQGLRVTSAHELYHAIQFRYLDLLSYWTFWFEASATGAEEIVHPDVDDYIQYLTNTAMAVGVTLEQLEESQSYGTSTLFLYNYNYVAHNADKTIWESLAKKPGESFQYHYSQLAAKQGHSADSLFHDYAIKLSLSGNQTKLVDTALWLNNDQNLWPEYQTVPTQKMNSQSTFPQLSYKFYTNGKPDLSDFKGKASVAIIKENSYEIRHLSTQNSVESTYTDIQNMSGVDSTIWILSRLSEDQALPYIVKDSTLRAYPTPWRHGALCFTPLPEDKEYIEIRNRRGSLVSKEAYSNNTLCLEESRVKELMVPGVYRFRAGNRGKLKDFIIVY